ncbi:hypothetical protein ASG22_19915 [Chryseobacterium sp. Leaf405]|uniref:hypothetical protein n=1 Tax=Chryseobacterium sp. Leaf405 TaxID=1736367 RepID=UPI0006F53241|nr:hypothetical protein [Chryseobacterium sp. Leaf405]KQT29592.1 hypothetical protein ASG22_19915 [Chryseobacterium sp. Leaf405]
MKQILILHILLLIFPSNKNFGQVITHDSATAKIAKLDPDTFLLGTFSDYMGRFRYVDRESQIDRYYPYEKPLAHFVEKFILDEYKIKAEAKFQEGGHSEIFSVKLAQKLHTQYYNDEGVLQLQMIDTNQKKYSYLTGIYYRYGNHLKENIYSIRVVNSMKNEDVYQLLKRLSCDRIIYRFNRGYIPAATVFYFEATPEMLQYFKVIEIEKKNLQESYEKVYVDSLLKGKEALKFKEMRTQNDSELISNIEYFFKD